MLALGLAKCVHLSFVTLAGGRCPRTQENTGPLCIHRLQCPALRLVFSDERSLRFPLVQFVGVSVAHVFCGLS
jgi:hypothetical protein